MPSTFDDCLAFVEARLKLALESNERHFTVTEVARERLERFPTDSNPESLLAPDAAPQAEVRALSAEASGICTRHYLISPTATTEMSAGDFPFAMRQLLSLRYAITAEEQLEIWMILVAPPGSESAREWLDAKTRFEGNQAFARVVVWLPDADASKWKEGVQDVLRQLFLEPLPNPATGGGTDLSPIDAILAAGLEPSFANAWRTILLESGSASTHAERLLEVGATPSQEGKTP
jgi:hypothetical protein